MESKAPLKKIAITLGVFLVIILFVINFFSPKAEIVTIKPSDELAMDEVLYGESFIYNNAQLTCSGVTRGEGEQIIDAVLMSQLKYEIISHEIYAIEVKGGKEKTFDIFIPYDHKPEQLGNNMVELAVEIGNILKARVHIIDGNGQLGSRSYDIEDFAFDQSQVFKAVEDAVED